MTRWLVGLAFVLFLALVVGMTHRALAAVDTVGQTAGRGVWQVYPPATNTPPSAYPVDKDTATPSPTFDAAKMAALQVTLTLTPPPTLTSIPGVGATATLVPTRTSTLLVSPSPTVPRTTTPTATVQPLPTLTVTPIRVTGLPVPGPGDRLPSTGGSMLTLLSSLLASGGLGGVLFALGRWLKRRA